MNQLKVLKYTIKSISGPMFLWTILPIVVILFFGSLDSSQSYFYIIEVFLPMCFVGLYISVLDNEKDVKMDAILDMTNISAWKRALYRYLGITLVITAVFLVIYMIMHSTILDGNRYLYSLPNIELLDNMLYSWLVFILSLLVLARVYLLIKFITKINRYFALGVVSLFWIALATNKHVPMNLFALSHELEKWYHYKIIWIVALIATDLIVLVIINKNGIIGILRRCYSRT